MTIINRLNDLKEMKRLFAGEKYILGLNAANKQIHIILKDDSDEIDQLKAAFQAEIINVLVELHKTETVSCYNYKLL